MWEQRFYTDGRLAPSWGYQIDETASVVFGIYAHYKVIREKKFLKETLSMCEKAVEFLKKYIDDILENKFQMRLSYDLWEEHEGYTLYSISSIFAAFSAMVKIYDELRNSYKEKSKKEEIDKKIESLTKYILSIREYCINNFYDEDKKSFVRNRDDKKMDISILSSIVPFRMFDINAVANCRFSHRQCFIIFNNISNNLFLAHLTFKIAVDIFSEFYTNFF